MKTPLIILNWQGLADTRECLAALEQQTFQDFEVYLVDNGSGREEQAELQHLYGGDQRIHLILNEENLGFTLGNNRVLEGLLKATGSPYVVLLNNDTATEPRWLEELLKAAKEQNADLVSSKMVNYFDRSRMDNAGHKLLNTLEALPIGNDEAVKGYEQPFENWGPCGGAALYATDMLREIGIFDEQFRNGYEDVELGLRAVLCGYKAVYAPRAVVYHKVSRSINKIRDFAYTLGIQRHVYYLMVKLFPWPVLLACLPFVLLRFLLALGINLLTGRGKFLRVQLAAVGKLFGEDRKPYLQARRSFLAHPSLISPGKILGKMEFFLRQDWKRFVKYVVRREKNVFEKY